MTNSRAAEFTRLYLVMLFALIVGLLAGRLVFVMLLAATAYASWQLWQLFRFERWLKSKKKGEAPEIKGLWGEIYYQVQRLIERNRRSKKRLASYLNRYEESTAALPDGVIVLYSDSTIEWFNETASRMLDLRSTLDVGQRIDNLIRHPDFVSYLGKGDYREPVQIPAPDDESKVFVIHIVPYADERRLMVVRDVTRMYRLEQIRRDFVANVSHELGTPLTVISGYLESLQERSDDVDKNIMEAVQQMSHQTHRMQYIVNDLLLLSRLESEAGTKMENVPIASLIRDVAGDYEHELGAKSQRLELSIDDDLCVHGNEQELYSAFSNLLSNAVKYTDDNGTIQLVWRRRLNGACFSVTDTGPGIPAQHISRLTERFYRVDVGRSRASGGTGLGLAIVKHVLSHHQAELRIESQFGKGSTFSCLFPYESVVSCREIR